MRIGFVGLMIWGCVIVGVGLFSLVIAIPWSASPKRNWHDSDAKTEFHTTHASYWCILTGLGLIMVAGVGATIVRAIQVLRGQ